MKAGTEYFNAWFDDETGKVHVDVAVLRTIRGRFGYMVAKVPGVTWGKLSRKHGDYGWLDPIPDYARSRFVIADGTPAGYGLSKSAAVRSALAAAREFRKRFIGRHGSEVETDESDAEIAALAAKLARL